MSERPTLYAEDKSHGTRSIRTAERTLRGWTPDLPEHADLDALWRILPRWCRCDGTGQHYDPTMSGKKFYDLACKECREPGPQRRGRGWLYPDQPNGPGWWRSLSIWRWYLIMIWRAMGIMGDTR